MDSKIQTVIETVPTLYRGPGGAVAVLKDGEVAGEYVWGFADLDRRIPMTNQTQMPICSISKQFVCQLLFDLERKPTPAMTAKGEDKDFWECLSKELAEMLPSELTSPKGNALKIADLCNMQSGLRDYWALTTLWGARTEGIFSLRDDAINICPRMKSFHFEPGTQFSYSNTNYYIVSRLIERISKQGLGTLLAERLFGPAGMSSASLCPNTFGHPQPCLGYEGDEEHGFRPAINRIEWAGDAGIVASLADMIAYEQYLDRSWSDPSSVYRKITEPQHYRDGSPANYGWGLLRFKIDDSDALGHGGGLRGFRSYRVHVPEKRLSVVVLLNYEAPANEASMHILKQVLNVAAEEPAPTVDPSPNWAGRFVDEHNQMGITISQKGQSEVSITYSRSSEPAKLVEAGQARSKTMVASIDGDSLCLQRFAEHAVVKARRLAKPDKPIDGSELLGEYHCAEIDSKLHCCGSAQSIFGWFEGFLGQGPAHLIRHLGEDVWLLADPRGMDAPAPGDWTLVFERDQGGAVTGVSVGCWLARRLDFVKM